MSVALKRRAAEAAFAFIEPGMRLGLGTGSTAAEFVDLLGARVAAGLDVVGVPTSARTFAQATALGIRLTTLEETPDLDLTVDGADEIGPNLALIKGGGGALLREKIVAASSAGMVVIADASKTVAELGAFPLPIEVVPFGFASTLRRLERLVAELGLTADLRLRPGPASDPYLTDGGHWIVDASFRRIPDPSRLATALDATVGVVEHGLFLGFATAAVVARDDGVEVLRP
ncbi:ribose-5-phosphate isomerase RpiA [Siculibacillus lacustris]|uniref:Ribose-5-phosphate isomerase A n=1 Tax=Siculibacillus lacustris TaxID=1549641 RepID=A0A4Q9VZL5_9HYPH|nr:ribose-5-phosphate isomerase RpiA [Siculibacillus lacustris]TBW40904.1 ribose-5-phosphate isomerase RpiA [Siculibacillus lacustris]